MKLLELIARNFMSLRSVTVKLSDAGITLIEGWNKDDETAHSNGSGKSAIVDALLWCLYGVTTHEPSADGDDVINRKIGRNCEVQVTFEVNEKSYTVTRRRGWKKGGKAVQLLFACDDGTDERRLLSFTKGTIKDTQTEIERVLGMSVTTFRTACVFGQGRAYRFSRLSDAEKKTVLDEMLGSEIYANASKTASDRLHDVEKSLLVVETKHENAVHAVEDSNERLRTLLRKQEAQERSRRIERGKLKQELFALGGQTDELMNASKRARDRYNEHRHTEHALTKTRSTLEAQLSKLSVERDSLRSKQRKLIANQGETCTTCLQPVNKEHVERHAKLIEKQIIKCNVEISNLDDGLLTNKQKLKIAHELEDALDAKYRGCRTREVQHVGKLEATKAKLKQLDKAADYDELIEAEREKLVKLRASVKTYEAQKAEQEKRCKELRFWQHGFGAKGLRSLLLDSTLPYLNAKLAQYSAALTGGNIHVEFKTQRVLKGGGLKEDFHVAVTNEFGADTYALNSIGERAKVDIIVGLALQDMAASHSRVPVNVAFFDEVFDGLDDQGVDRAIQMIIQLQRESVFVITHRSELKAFFSKRIVVCKHHGQSTILEDSNG